MSEGFFNLDEIQTDTCGQQCKLNGTCKHPYMKVSGKGKLDIMIVGEAPGSYEDERGMLWVGRTGKLLARETKRLDVDLHQDCWTTNAVACCPPGNRKPTLIEIDACRPRVINAIKEKQPCVVILLGDSAIQSVIGRTWKDKIGQVSRWRGQTIPDPELDCWLCPTWHPSHIAREKQKGAVNVIWRQDLERAFDLIEADVPIYGPHQINVITDLTMPLKHYVASANTNGVWAIDYETSGIKPDGEEHFIHTMAISNSVHTFAFPMTGRMDAWQDFVSSGNFAFVAHNAKFEERWTRASLGTEVRRWQDPHGDTMLNAHVLDNRRGICSLEFQAYINFGIPPWGTEMKPFLRTTENTGINNIKKAPLTKLLHYNGMDALTTHLLWQKQTERLK